MAEETKKDGVKESTYDKFEVKVYFKQLENCPKTKTVSNVVEYYTAQAGNAMFITTNKSRSIVIPMNNILYAEVRGIMNE